MKTIIIGASRNNKIGSKAIQWWIGVDYSHVYSKWYLSDQDREIVYQASHGMVHFISSNHFNEQNTIVEEFKIELTCDQFAKFSTKCIDLAGESYSRLELLQIFLSDISNGKFKTEDQPGYICSELMCELLTDLGYTFKKPKYLINPKDIVECLKKGLQT
jgi:hypothetical protein